MREAEPLLRANMVDIVIIDVEAGQIESGWKIEQLRRISPELPSLCSLMRTASGKKKLSARCITCAAQAGSTTHAQHLDRTFAYTNSPGVIKPVAPVAAPGQYRIRVHRGAARERLQSLNVVRDFSCPHHSLEADGLLREFLLLLRGILGVKPGGHFLRETSGDSNAPSMPRLSECAQPAPSASRPN